MLEKTLVVLTTLFAAAVGWAQQPAPAAKLPANYDRLIAYSTAEVAEWVMDPIIVQAVLKKNAQKETLAEIHRIDKEWVSAVEPTSLMKSLLSNPCAVRLSQLQKRNPAYSKTFVHDAQGANVCMTIRTDDYWQGDEDKWLKTFKVGKDAVLVDKPYYDPRLKATVVQISRTISDHGQPIGALTATIDLDWLARK
jgi:hypothetical protein